MWYLYFKCNHILDIPLKFWSIYNLSCFVLTVIHHQLFSSEDLLLISHRLWHRYHPFWKWDFTRWRCEESIPTCLSFSKLSRIRSQTSILNHITLIASLYAVCSITSNIRQTCCSKILPCVWFGWDLMAVHDSHPLVIKPFTEPLWHRWKAEGSHQSQLILRGT